MLGLERQDALIKLLRLQPFPGLVQFSRDRKHSPDKDRVVLLGRSSS
jgi:hypothetical protein